MGWLSERLRRRREKPERPEDIEAEDLSHWLVRCTRQPGRSALTVMLVGQRNEGTEKPTIGTWATIWWN